MLHENASLRRVQQTGYELWIVQQQLGGVTQHSACQQEGVIRQIRLFIELLQPHEPAAGTVQKLAQELSCNSMNFQYDLVRGSCSKQKNSCTHKQFFQLGVASRT